MRLKVTKCINSGVEYFSCPKCDGIKIIKSGKTASGRQRYQCCNCRSRFQSEYSNNAYYPETNSSIINLLKEGSGIRSISRLLKISTTTVIKRIIQIAGAVRNPMIPYYQKYELDEMCTIVGNKDNRIWIAYAIRKDTKEVVDFRVGKRTNKTLRGVVESLLFSHARTICTDKLRNYASLIPKSIHRTKQYNINHIERMNLSLRTHLKRLNRRTICFSRSLVMLSACLKIYFWASHIKIVECKYELV